jgi:hypothetical protein
MIIFLCNTMLFFAFFYLSLQQNEYLCMKEIDMLFFEYFQRLYY